MGGRSAIRSSSRKTKSDSETSADAARVRSVRCTSSGTLRIWIVFTSANGVRFFFEEFYRIFDDVRSLYTAVLRHRVLLNFHAESDRVSPDDVLRQVLDATPAPRE